MKVSKSAKEIYIIILSFVMVWGLIFWVSPVPARVMDVPDTPVSWIGSTVNVDMKIAYDYKDATLLSVIDGRSYAGVIIENKKGFKIFIPLQNIRSIRLK